MTRQAYNAIEFTGFGWHEENMGDGSRSAPRSFGERLRKARLARRMSQRELAAAVGISQRMLIYYELYAKKVPTQILLPLARALAVTADELLGLKKNGAPEDAPAQGSRLWRKLRVVESFPPQDRRYVVQMIQTIAERNALRHKRQAEA